MEYVFAGKILGKYVNVTTAVKAGRYTDAKSQRRAMESDHITTRIDMFPPKWNQ